MPHDLTPLRRLEARRTLQYLLDTQTDADEIIDRLSAVMVGVPDVVVMAAHHLKAWNNTNGEDDPYFMITNEGITYGDIAERVLDAAAVYRGETTDAPKKMRLVSPSDNEIIITLNRAAEFLRFVADGRTNRQTAETYASKLAQLAGLLGYRFDVSNETREIDDNQA